jgi:hypothetical protein
MISFCNILLVDADGISPEGHTTHLATKSFQYVNQVPGNQEGLIIDENRKLVAWIPPNVRYGSVFWSIGKREFLETTNDWRPGIQSRFQF